jgi:hypothetical protein
MPDSDEAPKLPLLQRIFLLLDDLNVRTRKTNRLLEAQIAQETWTESFVLAIPPNTPVNKEVSQEVMWPFDGRLTQVVLFFPTGAAGTAAVFFTKENEQLFPPKEGSSIALDGIALPYKINAIVKRADKISFKGNNSDTNSHTVRAQLTGIETLV